jgi:tetratricopeptide (TPR) repeat protein
MSRAHPWSGIALRIKGLARNPIRESAAAEAHLYYRRASLAAAEERFDVALIFCGKALAIDGGHLSTRLLVARIHDRGLADVDAAVAAYRKVITLCGYDGGNPYCAAARAALNALVQAEFEGATEAAADRALAASDADNGAVVLTGEAAL